EREKTGDHKYETVAACRKRSVRHSEMVELPRNTTQIIHRSWIMSSAGVLTARRTGRRRPAREGRRQRDERVVLSIAGRRIIVEYYAIHSLRRSSQDRKRRTRASYLMRA
ncbi:hypothetical protein, partial [Halorubrum sp. Ib24]|uniref:hypothetical protein n=1 Tax=Halorubrum sp. Ib24 TaxID=1383850 RepID=UPI001A7E07EF